MLPTLDIHLDEKDVARCKQMCAAFPSLLETALQKAEKTTRSVLRRHVTKKLKAVVELPGTSVTRAVTARQRNGAQEVRIASGQIPLISYKITPLIRVPPKGIASRDRPRTWYRLRRGGRLYDDSRVRGEEAVGRTSKLFVTTVRGRTAVFYRTESDDALHEKRGPSLQWHMYEDGMIPEVQEYVRQSLFRNLENELNRLGVSRL